MKSLLLILTGLLVGALCALAAAKAVATRHAHERATMVVLAHHMDALRRIGDEAACAGEPVLERLQQIGFAAQELKFAFPDLDTPGSEFARRRHDLQQAADSAAADGIGSCQDLAQATGTLARVCQECHRRYQ